MTTPRRAARAAATRAQERPPFDWRAPEYGIKQWPPGPGNPVTVSAIMAARRRARQEREQWERKHRPPHGPLG